MTDDVSERTEMTRRRFSCIQPQRLPFSEITIEAARQALARLGCDMARGYRLGRPCSADRIASMLGAPAALAIADRHQEQMHRTVLHGPGVNEATV